MNSFVRYFRLHHVLLVIGFMIITAAVVASITFAAEENSTVEVEDGVKVGAIAEVTSDVTSGGSAIKFGSATSATRPPSTGTTGGGATGSSASGVPMPTGDLGGGKWKLAFADDFTKDAPLGSFKSESDAGKIVYTGATGTKWVAYPETYKDTYQKRPYMSGDILSVHDGVLDFYLHPVNGQPAGANPSPLINGQSQYQTYGRYSARFKVVPTKGNMSEYYAAWLLWPTNDSDYQCAESDYPEGSFDSEPGGFHHYGCNGDQDSIDTQGAKYTDWHTYTQEWEPGKRTYYVDDKVVGTSTNQVWDKEQRWQLQTETNGDGTSEGHVLVDWAVVWTYGG